MRNIGIFLIIFWALGTLGSALNNGLPKSITELIGNLLWLIIGIILLIKSKKGK